MSTLCRVRFGDLIVRMKIRGTCNPGDRVQREYGGEVGVVVEVLWRMPR